MTMRDRRTGKVLDIPDLQVREKPGRAHLANQIAKRVTAYRTEHKLTQTELARMLGMRQPHVARLEAGDHEPSLATLSRLARVFDVEFHIVITRTAVRLTA
jgi:predicted transcriptional regulator